MKRFVVRTGPAGIAQLWGRIPPFHASRAPHESPVTCLRDDEMIMKGSPARAKWVREGRFRNYCPNTFQHRIVVDTDAVEECLMWLGEQDCRWSFKHEAMAEHSICHPGRASLRFTFSFHDAARAVEFKLAFADVIR